MGRALLEWKNDTSPTSVSPCTCLCDSGLLSSAQRLVATAANGRTWSSYVCGRPPAAPLLHHEAQVARIPRDSGFTQVYGFPSSPAFKNFTSVTHSPCLAPPQLRISFLSIVVVPRTPHQLIQPGLKPKSPSLLPWTRAPRKQQVAHFAFGEPSSYT